MKITVKLGLWCILGIALPSLAFGQTTAPAVEGSAGQMTVNYLQNVGNANAPGVVGFDHRYDGIKGHPYFLDLWLPGSMEVQEGNTQKTKIFKDLRLKYDVYGNQLGIVIPATKDTIFLSLDAVKSFQLQLPGYDSLIELRKYPEIAVDDLNLAQPFFAVLHQGKVSLLKRTHKLKIDADYKGAYSASRPYDELVDQVHYYVINNGQAQKIKLNRKSVLEALADQEEKVKSFLKKEKLNLNSELELVKVISYYNSL